MLILVRHGEVDEAYRGLCYGAMDVPLSERGERDSVELAIKLAAQFPASEVFHSGLSRTEFMARTIAGEVNRHVSGEDRRAIVTADRRLQERDYGDWQGMTWDAAYASDPEHFHGLIAQPDSYRPPGGETTSEMQQRIVEWFDEKIRNRVDVGPSAVIAIAHSGPIAALCGHLTGTHAMHWQDYMLKTSTYVRIEPTKSLAKFRLSF